MKKLNDPTILSILLAYFFPVFAFSSYAVYLTSPKIGWPLLLLGLFIASTGSILFLTLLQPLFSLDKNKKKQLLKNTPSLPSQKNSSVIIDLPVLDAPKFQWLEDQKKYEETIKNLEQKLSQKEYLIEQTQKENKKYQERIEQLKKDFTDLKEIQRNQPQPNPSILEEYKKTITEQRKLLDEKKSLIISLEREIEILKNPNTPLTKYQSPLSKTVPLFPQEENAPSKGENDNDLKKQLKRCLNIAQKIAGAAHFSGPSSRFPDLMMNSFAIDARRLFDSFQSESSGIILLYSQKEEKLLFAHNRIKDLIGLSSDKFIQNFFDIIEGGKDKWHHIINQVVSKKESSATLSFKTKDGQTRSIQSELGIIPTGTFKRHVVAILQWQPNPAKATL